MSHKKYTRYIILLPIYGCAVRVRGSAKFSDGFMY